MAKAKEKSKSRQKAAKIGKQIETNSVEMAHKIWLAGVGAYGKAYDTAVTGAQPVNAQSADVFEELVKRGEEIESDVRARLMADERVLKAGQSVAKATEAAREFQSQARDQFENRMERMRDLLGVKSLGTRGEKIAKQLDKLEDDVADMAAKAKAKVGDVNLKARIARLTAEIEAVAGEAGSDLAKAAKKVGKAAKTAVAPVEAEAPKAKKAAKKVKAKAKVKTAAKAKSAPKAKDVKIVVAKDDLTQITGVGPALVKKLNAAGISSFAQIAALKKADIIALDDKIGARGRIERNDWVKQAKTLAKK